MIIVFDLDDTLYDELEFVASGFAAVANAIDPCRTDELCAHMWSCFERDGSGRVFDDLAQAFAIATPVAQLVATYRSHTPTLTMPPERRATLERLRANHTLAILTDGASETQRNKIAALGLVVDAIVFTDSLGAPKPAPEGFEQLMARFGADERFVYIGDNPRKDFEGPRALGWSTIRFRNPRGIYRECSGVSDFEIFEWNELEGLIATLGLAPRRVS